MFDFNNSMIFQDRYKFTPDFLDKGDIIIEDCPEWQEAIKNGEVDKYIDLEGQVVVGRDLEYIKVRHISGHHVIDDVDIRLDSYRVFVKIGHTLLDT